jgi:hypothetical protein
MSIYLPYFYLIKHKSSGKLYAGSRTTPQSKLANPTEFMKPDGYQTSSKIIKEIIKNEGLDAIEILDIVTIEDLRIPFGISDIHQYETWFLK